MKTIFNTYKTMVAKVPTEVLAEVDLSFAISDELDAMIRAKGLTKKQFAEEIGKHPSEVTKWLSGQHNFTLRTISMLSAYFGKPLVVPANYVR
ncbi:MAG TPA: XRE family transcriptional regulator [Bacteroidales bacterium]|nr:XRE family transcriptional regulator [Bacteroidales bacterium]